MQCQVEKLIQITQGNHVQVSCVNESHQVSVNGTRHSRIALIHKLTIEH
jgi:hypothetical protein